MQVMEVLVERAKKASGSFVNVLIPYIRQVIRFLALPYCMIATVDHADCPRSGLQVAADMLYIFFRLGYYPDNYGKCRLWEVPRREWRFYFGSSYNPFQRARLSREVQRPRYGVVFADKQVAQIVADGAGIAGPRCHGYIGAGQTIQGFMAGMDPDVVAGSEFIAKPVLGAEGRAIYKIVSGAGASQILDGQGRSISQPVRVREQYIVQDAVKQHPDLARVHGRSLNTLRMLTLMTRDDRSLLLAVFVRFGIGESVIDNLSAGGVAAGVDLDTGVVMPRGLNDLGHCFTVHPTAGIPFSDIVIPLWPEVVAFAKRVQDAFPFYRLLGLDVAIAPEGPVLIEINDRPDLISQEQTSGPLFADPEVLAEFDRYDLLTHSMARCLAVDLARARSLPPAGRAT